MANKKAVKAAGKAAGKSFVKPGFPVRIPQVPIAVFQTLRWGTRSFFVWFWRTFWPASGWKKAVAMVAILLLCLIAIWKS